MSFDWSAFLALARDLATKSPESAIPEALLRSSISRAYYAVFHRAYALLIQEDPFGDRRMDKHRWTIDEFQNHRDGNRRHIGIRLERLRNNRASADYDDVFRSADVAFRDLPKACEWHLRLAEQVIQNLEHLK